MIFVKLLLLASFLVPALAGKFSLPIVQTRGFAPKSYSSFEKRNNGAQKPMNGNSKVTPDAYDETLFSPLRIPIEVCSSLLLDNS